MNPAALGSFALAVGLFAAVAAAVLWTRVGRGREDPANARLATWLLLAGAVAACGAMEWALVGNDFSLRYVAENSSRATPLFFRITALWSALDGSLLLWLLVLAGYAVLVARRPAPAASRLQPWAAATVCVVGACFFAMSLFAAAPFTQLTPAAADGPGPNPLLADHPAMGVHPPLLYLGYVGLVVPFAYAVAALVVGEAGRDWLEVTRRWVLVAWSTLTAGIVLGAWWSYAVLGWGGYWAWDPVENASLLPWLTATALLHSALVQRRRSTLATWNVALAASSFVLVCAGTFLTRSGAVASVHSFTQSPLGPVLLGFLALVVASVLGLLLWRGDLLTMPAGTDRPPRVLSRDTGLHLNNLLLVGLAVCVLLGTLFPLLVQAVSGQEVSVGAPFYDRTAVPVALALLVLMALGPLAAWDGETPGRLARRAVLPLATAAVVLGVLGLSGARGAVPVVTLALAAAVVVSSLRSLGRDIRPQSLGRRRRAVGGQLAHVGLAVAAAGIAASSAWSSAAEASLTAGEQVRTGGATVRLDDVQRVAVPGRMTTSASVTATRGGDAASPAAQQAGDQQAGDQQAGDQQTLSPALVFYPARGMTVSTPAIWSTWTGDVYITVLDVAQDGSSARIRVVVEPLVGWLWAGGALMVLGAAVAAVPRRGRQRRTVPQTASAPVPVAPAPVGS